MNYIRELRAVVGHRPLVLAVAGVLVLDADGQLLLHRRADNAMWGTPSGAVEPGESVEDTARRELRAKTGLDAGRLRLLDVYSGPDFFVRHQNGDEAYIVGALFLAEDVRGEPKARGVGYFSFDGLPEDVDPYSLRLLERSRQLVDDAVAERG